MPHYWLALFNRTISCKVVVVALPLDLLYNLHLFNVKILLNFTRFLLLFFGVKIKILNTDWKSLYRAFLWTAMKIVVTNKIMISDRKFSKKDAKTGKIAKISGKIFLGYFRSEIWKNVSSSPSFRCKKKTSTIPLKKKNVQWKRPSFKNRPVRWISIFNYKCNLCRGLELGR